MSVLSDWRDGRIQGWVEAPTDPEDRGEGVGERKVVEGWAKEFRLEGLWGDDDGNEGAWEEGMEVS